MMPHDPDSPKLAPLWRALLILLLVVVAASIPFVVWYAYEYSSISKGSGGYQLRVHVESARPIRAVRCYATYRSEGAEAVADNHHAEWDILPRNGRAEPFTGAPFELRIDTWSETTRSGSEISGGQDEWLTVVAEFDDGTRVGKVVEIPDMQTGREVRIEFP